MRMSKWLRSALDDASHLDYELQFVIDERSDDYDRRSERWQASEQAEAHVELTELIEELARAVKQGINDIEAAHE